MFEVRRRMLTALSLAAIAVGGGVGQARAEFINGSFETGNFTGWTTSGDARVVSALFGVTPPDGNFQALMTTGAGSTSAAALEAFLDLAPGALTAVGNGTAVEGSAIRQVLSFGPGDILGFRFDFLTNESTNPPDVNFNDFAFVTVDSQVFRLADLASPFVPAPGVMGFFDHTGYLAFAGGMTPGVHTIGFGVVDVGLDGLINSGLLVDRVTVVPEPSSVVLLGLGGLGLLGVASRRRAAA